MDREFIGQKWLPWLKRASIDFCVRIPKHHSILFEDGRKITATEILSLHSYFCLSNGIVDSVCVNLSISYDKNGDLLFLIGTKPPTNLKIWYRKRWTIEVFLEGV